MATSSKHNSKIDIGRSESHDKKLLLKEKSDDSQRCSTLIEWSSRNSKDNSPVNDNRSFFKLSPTKDPAYIREERNQSPQRK